MFKCCVCNKSSKKEKPNSEMTKSTPKQNQKAIDSQLVNTDSLKTEENGPIEEEKKLNGNIQRFEKVSSSMENNSVEIIDDLTVKSPLPIGKRDENNDNSRLRIESIKKLNDADNNDDKENASDRTNIENKNKELNRIKNANRNEKVEENDNINGNDKNGSNENGMMKAILNSGISGTIKTNLYNSSAYIERTIDDGPEEEGDDSVFEACPNDTNANKKTPPVSSIPRWLSEEEDGDSEECSGMQEPPATPVARDELALRRHRFFSDLLHAAQNATEHRVRFDPLGPMVHAG